MLRRIGKLRYIRITLVVLLLSLSAVACAGQWGVTDEQSAARLGVSAGDEQPAPASKTIGERVRNGALIGQAVATIIAIGLGGVFAWRRGFLFRHGQPHITIDHQITHRPVSPEYIHIEVTATLRNTSLVKVEIRDGLFIVQQLAPASGDYVSDLYRRAFVDRNPRYYQPLEWAYLEEIPRVWNPDELIIEPGSSAAVTFEYVVAGEIQSALITTHFYNTKVLGKIPAGTDPRHAESRRRWWGWRATGSKGWNRTTAYDIMSIGGSETSETAGG